jgi:hypothetical protein
MPHTGSSPLSQCEPSHSRRTRTKAIQDKLDRLAEAFFFERSIDMGTYDRHTEKLCERQPFQQAFFTKESRSTGIALFEPA